MEKGKKLLCKKTCFNNNNEKVFVKGKYYTILHPLGRYWDCFYTDKELLSKKLNKIKHG